VLTIFAVPKAFSGDDARIQRNALRSWLDLDMEREVILFGDDPGVREASELAGARHVPDVLTNEHGRPLLHDVFDRAQSIASHGLLMYVNADIILMDPLARAIERLADQALDFLAVCRRVEVNLEMELSEIHEWQSYVRELATRSGMLATPWAIDAFLFPRGSVGPMPPFAVGKPGWDNWMIYHARASRRPVVDLTADAALIHQDIEPGYARGKRPDWSSEESLRNRWLAGWGIWFSIDDATHRLVESRLVRRAIWKTPARRLAQAAKSDPALRAATMPLRGLVRAARERVQGPEATSWLRRPGPPPCPKNW
jgi:hypothetical protein